MMYFFHVIADLTRNQWLGVNDCKQKKAWIPGRARDDGKGVGDKRAGLAEHGLG